VHRGRSELLLLTQLFDTYAHVSARKYLEATLALHSLQQQRESWAQRILQRPSNYNSLLGLKVAVDFVRSGFVRSDYACTDLSVGVSILILVLIQRTCFTPTCLELVPEQRYHRRSLSRCVPHAVGGAIRAFQT